MPSGPRKGLHLNPPRHCDQKADKDIREDLGGLRRTVLNCLLHKDELVGESVRPNCVCRLEGSHDSLAYGGAQWINCCLSREDSLNCTCPRNSQSSSTCDAAPLPISITIVTSEYKVNRLAHQEMVAIIFVYENHLGP